MNNQELDRGIPSVNTARDNFILGSGKKIAVIALGLVALAVTWSYAVGSRETDTEKRPVPASTAGLPPLQIIEHKEPAPEPLPEPEPAALTLPPPPAFVPPPPQVLQVREERDPAAEAWELRKKAPILAFSGSDRASAGVDEATEGGSLTGEDDELGLRLKPTKSVGAAARVLGDRNFLIAKGTMLDCALQTAIDTTQVGFTSCLLSGDVWSDNGKVLLVEKGSMVTGQYYRGIKQGQERVFVLWDRIKTPSGVIVDINSPGTDPLGRSGHEGFIDTHFWSRFGGAILLSMIDDLSSAAATQLADGDFENTQTAAKEQVGDVLEETINIPPTLRKNQGDHISIFVARDLDFSDVYKLSLVR